MATTRVQVEKGCLEQKSVVGRGFMGKWETVLTNLHRRSQRSCKGFGGRQRESERER